MDRPVNPIPLWEGGAPGFNAEYGQPQPTLTPFWADESNKPRGAVIVCPGGGYVTKARHEGTPIACKINESGVHAFVLSYRVAPYSHPAPLSDAQRAIRVVRANAGSWGVLPDRIGILGFSAGGHLAAHAGTTYDAGDPGAADPIDRVSCRPDAILPCYAVMSGVAVSLGHRGSFQSLTGRGVVDGMTARMLSPDQWVTRDTPPAFIWHTAEDPVVPVENALLFAAAMSAHKRPFSLHIFPYGRHGIGLGEDQPLAKDWTRLMGDWLKEFGFGG
ncbi:MAG: alpha/beta hydrolase [Oscillospiraceae bacterium]|jgi:acetyl esterase/lipase|nr:alpha/beta hydrolase [Oscillospiraceae bacterium]